MLPRERNTASKTEREGGSGSLDNKYSPRISGRRVMISPLNDFSSKIEGQGR